jgi:hypothetical protein
MKTFTKIFLATMMAVVYMTGYGANLKAKVNNEGSFIPKTPTLSATPCRLPMSRCGPAVPIIF